jgi:type II secretory pathway pseudopilin PulG
MGAEMEVQGKLHGSEKTFTLVELTVAVIVVAALAALAIPHFMRTTTKGKQTEARLILKQIYTMERAYRQNKNVYYPGDGSTVVAQPGDDIGPLGAEIAPAVYHSYSITGDGISFTATAGSKGAAGRDDDGNLDVWTVDQTGSLTVTTDDALD